MTWTNHLVVCLVVIHACCIMGDITSLEEFLEEKDTYRQEIDRLFYKIFWNGTLDQHTGDTNTHEGHRSKPIPSPDWSTHSTTADDVYDEHLEASQATLLDDENYRPRVEASGRGAFQVDDQEDTSEEDGPSGDSDVFRPHDDEDDLIFPVDYPLVHWESTTLAHAVPNIADKLACVEFLKVESNSCIDMSLNVRAIFREVETFVPESGYYDVTSSNYLVGLFRSCLSSKIVPQSCAVVSDIKRVVVEVIDGISTFTRRNEDDNLQHKLYECFPVHADFLVEFLVRTFTNERLERVYRMVLTKEKSASVMAHQEGCRDFEVLSNFVCNSLCVNERSTSPQLVHEMFETTIREATSCLAQTSSTSGNGADAMMTSRDVVITLALSILALYFHKQTQN